MCESGLEVQAARGLLPLDRSLQEVVYALLDDQAPEL